ncbi:DoxX family protein [Roseateles sp.]|uniref:DoxX family protein n=1 Tax=Roseateles sp. TaxID=1971397 RepID=UPI0025CEA54B|nr:DoxX family protein [Roseateles sp.]MBV8036556.1 DoxX family protein [Roseateles sp.]
MSTAIQTPTLSSVRASSGAGSALRPATELLGRVSLVALFLLSGVGKLAAYQATSGYMSAMGVPAALLPLVIVTEVLGAVAVIAGWRTRFMAVLLAGFTLLSGLLFHSNFGDQIQMTMFLKNLSIAGAFLMLAANGAGRYSLDVRQGR